MQKIKVFLSHSMSGLSEEKCLKIREDAKKHIIEKMTDKEIEFIDNYHHSDAPEGAKRLWHLGRSIQQLEEADYIYFCPLNCDAKGCYIEHEIAKMYHIRILNQLIDDMPYIYIK